MTTNRVGRLLPLLLLLTACATPPRVTTEAERLQANSALNVAQAALIVAAPKMKPEQVQLATEVIAGLRARVADSEFTPTDFSALLLDIATAAAQWEALR